MRNMLFKNNGSSLPFSEIGQFSGIYQTDWSWSPLFADFDYDGNKDLLENNKCSIPKHIDLILFNNSKINENNEIEQMKFSFFKDFYNNYNNLTFKKNIIIKPIYISNNQLLN